MSAYVMNICKGGLSMIIANVINTVTVMRNTKCSLGSEEEFQYRKSTLSIVTITDVFMLVTYILTQTRCYVMTCKEYLLNIVLQNFSFNLTAHIYLLVKFLFCLLTCSC